MKISAEWKFWLEFPSGLNKIYIQLTFY